MLIFIIFLSTVVIEFMQAASPTTYSTRDSTIKKSKSICDTPECSYWASEILKNLNQNVDPCNNFYEFACGGFNEANKIPDDEVEVNAFTKMSDRVHTRVKEMLEEPIQENEFRPFVLAKTLYNYCTDLQSIENAGLEPIKKILKRLGGWPVIEGSGWIEKKFNWKTTTCKIQSEAAFEGSLLVIIPAPSRLNSSQYIIQITQPSLLLDREYLLKGFDDNTVKAYYNYIASLAEVLGAEKDNALREMRETVNFRIELAKITVALEEMRNQTLLINYMTVRELQEKFPSIPWIDFINSAIKEGEVEINLDDVVNVMVPKYVSDLEVLLSGTSERIIHNYLISEIVTDLVDFSTKALYELKQKYFQTKFNLKSITPRWKSCFDVLKATLPISVSALYVQKYFSDKSKENAERLVNNIKEVFHDMIVNINWMDENTKFEAIKKETAILTRVAYPEEVLNTEYLEKYYTKMNLSATNYLEAAIQAARFRFHKFMSKLQKPVDKNEWPELSSATDVNAYYASSLNAIIIPAGILQKEFFESNRPHYMNYGAMGYVIGHEITHGFDDLGRQFDSKGDVVDWWNETTKQLFLEKAQCIIDQYNNYTVPEIQMNINGINTQGESIADNGGIKQAYLAYQKWIKDNGEEPQLPGLDYTPRQLFWISTANLWCENSRSEALKDMIIKDTHPPSRFRIIGPLSNSEYFSKDFNCPEGSPMNPTKKCHVW